MVHHKKGGGIGFVTDPVPFVGHRGSVEDIQWSPTQPGVFASCGVDGTIRIWEGKEETCKISVVTHTMDVKVISWNTYVLYL